MRKSVYFSQLLRRFEASSLIDRNSVFQLMKKNAKTFADWYEIHRYGDSNAQYESLEKMKELVLKEERVRNIQRNILELFELVTDSSEQEKVLGEYHKCHVDKDDLLFVLSVGDPASDLWSEVYDFASKYYVTLGGLSKGIKARQNKNVKIMK